MVTWTFALMASLLVSWLFLLLQIHRINLTHAEIVVLKPHSFDPGSLHSVDVTREVEELLGQGCKQMSLIPRLLTMPVSEKIRDVLTHCISEHPTSKHPLCFLDVQYAMKHRWTSHESVYRCLYPIHTFSEVVSLPPSTPLVPTIVNFKLKSDWSSISSAMLTLRCKGDTRRQLSCNVTTRLQLLSSPVGDFHRHSDPGYQLRRHILKVVLMPDIRALVESLERELLLDEGGHSQNGNESTDSLKSLASVSLPRKVVSIRIHFKQKHHRVEVMNL